MLTTAFHFWKNKQASINFVAALLALTLPISSALPNLLLIPLGLLIIFNFKNFQFKKSVPVLVLSISALLIIFLSVFNGTFQIDAGLYSRFFVVLLLFVLFTQVTNQKLVEHFFLIGAFIALIGSAIAVGVHSYHNPGFLLDYGSVVNHLLWLERPYFGIILSLGTFLCLKNAEKYNKKDYYLLALIFIGFSIYISARLSILLNCILIAVFLLKSNQIQSGTKLLTGFTIVLLVAVALGLSDNLMSRMKITNDWERTAHRFKDFEPRFIIWPCAVDIIKNDMNLATGLNSYDKAEEKLTNCYAASIEKEDKRNYYLDRKFNTHNQFLDFLLVGGIFPFLLLLYSFFHAWFSKKTSFELKIVFLMFFAFFMVENVLHRQLGCFLFGIFVALYSTGRNGKD